VLVAFIGIDGSGKTTLAKNILRKLRQNSDVNAVIICPFDYILLKYLLAILRNIHETKFRRGPFLIKDSQSVIIRFWPYLALIDNLIYFMLRIKPISWRNKYVICDRYFYDFITIFEYLGYCGHIMSSIYSSAIPRPDITFLLDVNPEIARKREINDRHNPDFFIEQRNRYISLANKLDFKIIRTNQRIEKAEEEIMCHISNYLRER